MSTHGGLSNKHDVCVVELKVACGLVARVLTTQLLLHRIYSRVHYAVCSTQNFNRREQWCATNMKPIVITAYLQRQLPRPDVRNWVDSIEDLRTGIVDIVTEDERSFGDGRFKTWTSRIYTESPKNELILSRIPRGSQWINPHRVKFTIAFGDRTFESADPSEHLYVP